MIYHTWRGVPVHEEDMTCNNGTLTITVPSMHITGSHANYIGQDIAFILERYPEPVSVAQKSKSSVPAK
jgi:hypothetical protein